MIASSKPLHIKNFSIKNFIRSLHSFILLGLLFSSIATLANFALLFLSGWFLAAATVAGLGGITTQNLFNMFLPASGVRFFATIRILALYAERITTHDGALKITALIRSKTFQAMIPRSMMLTTQARNGDILARFVNDTELMGQYPLNVYLPRQNALICSIIIIAIFAAFNLQSAFILTFSLSLGGIILPVLLHLATSQQSQYISKKTETLKSDILETLQGMADIIFCGAARHYIHKLETQQKELNRHHFLYQFYGHLLRQLLAIISLLTLITIIIISTLAYQNHLLTAPEIPMLVLGTLAAFEIIDPLLEAQLSAAKITYAEKNIVNFCTSPLSVPTIENEGISDNITEFSLSFKNITLTLNGQKLYQNLNFNLKQGTHIAITGPSGIGKTTLTRLATRLISPHEGKIYLGGHSLEEFTTETLSHHIALLSQKPHLFLGTIRRNLLIAAPYATEEDMWEALKTVQLHDDIHSMPNQLDSLCGEAGVKLSGGQIKRLAVAQILLRRPKILILDEPTESLPPQTAITMMEALFQALPNITMLCITHRPEPLKFMDDIYELKNGQLLKKSKAREKN